MHKTASEWAAELWTDTPVLVIDTETTGVRTADQICEVTLLVAANGVVTDEYTTLVNPRCPIHPEASSVHGLYDADVADAPVIEDVADDILEYLSAGLPLVAHNMAFDSRFLMKTEGIRDRWPSGIPTLCTLDFAKHRNPQTKALGSHKLLDLSRMFGLYKERAGMHRSRADTIALAELLPKLMRGQTVGGSMTKSSEAWIKR